MRGRERDRKLERGEEGEWMRCSDREWNEERLGQGKSQERDMPKRR